MNFKIRFQKPVEFDLTDTDNNQPPKHIRNIN